VKPFGKWVIGSISLGLHELGEIILHLNNTKYSLFIYIEISIGRIYEIQRNAEINRK